MSNFAALAELYSEMESAYDQVASRLVFSCRGCPDNCCDSYFQHHTYLEWAYLWQGLAELPAGRLADYQARAREAVASYRAALAQGERPQVMCPVNDHGRCGLYRHRLLICRLHGVPASLTSPNGKLRRFPGCFRCQELTQGAGDLPSLDRTRFFKTMVRLEQEFIGARSRPRVRMSLAEMLLRRPPA